MDRKIPVILFLALLIVACGGKSNNNNAGLPVPHAPTRHYDAKQLALGEKVYQANCAKCHGARAEGAPHWTKRGADGKYPAPPLNGTGHAWHHSTRVLSDTIHFGSPKEEGNMPAWQGKLSEQEITAVILWFQSKWPQPLYDAWYEMQQRDTE
jgi:mono/diheme cytochrome c family protein